MPWNVYHSTVEGLCPGMLIIHPLRAYALGCFNHPTVEAHALECLSFNARKMVPHAYCICCCHRCIVGVVVGESLSLLWLLLLAEFEDDVNVVDV